MEHQKQKAVRLAPRLSQFLRVRTAPERDEFQQRWPEFFPEKFWTWKVHQVPPGAGGVGQPLPALPMVEFWRGYQDALREAWKQKFPLAEVVRLLVAPVAQGVDALSSLPTYDYQLALALLALEPWRAKWCLECGEPFAAEHQARRFCSKVCSDAARRAGKRTWWGENAAKVGGTRRESRQRKTGPKRR